MDHRALPLTRDKDSGIPNDPNDWVKEHKQPRYILDLLKRVVRVSVETVKIVNSLPPSTNAPPNPIPFFLIPKILADISIIPKPLSPPTPTPFSHPH